MSKKYRVAVIGATGRGNYGHGLDEAFQGVEGTELVAVADADAKGLAAAGAKLDVSSLWADYRQMLGAEKPDIAVVCPGWVSERVPMIEAAAAAGCHIYCEKPVAGTLAEADAIVAACQDVKVAVAHQWRGMPPIQQTITDVRAGAYGRPLRLRARPKDDSRGGGEEFLLHGNPSLRPDGGLCRATALGQRPRQRRRVRVASRRRPAHTATPRRPHPSARRLS